MTAPNTDPSQTVPLDSDWRAEAKHAQAVVLPVGPTIVSGSGPYGAGGLGQHLAELVEALRKKGTLTSYLTPAPRPEDSGYLGIQVDLPKAAKLAQIVPPVRFSLGWKAYLDNVAFDVAASRRMPLGAKNLFVFNGHALRHFKVARKMGYESVGLISANSHLTHVARQQEKAWRQYPIERPWGSRLESRNLAEYQAADLVYVSSRYAWDSFVSEGFPEERLRLFPLTPHERFQLRPPRPSPTTFNIVYVGILSVHKGVPLLVESFKSLPNDDMRLVLVGGWSSRGMRRFIEKACVQDSRIIVRPGDPLPQLLQAGVCVHPSYSEGCSYAPAEALACGVPLITSQDSGMNEGIPYDPSRRWTVPTGDRQALTEAIENAYRVA